MPPMSFSANSRRNSAMVDLNGFISKLEQRLAAANRVPRWLPGDAEQYMAQVTARRQRWEQLASSLTETVIRPRLKALASRFPNTRLPGNEPLGRCSCWFGYCERFPASVRLSFAVEHDVTCATATVSYEAYMMPMFFKFDEHDKLTLPLEQVNEVAIAAWVEKRLFEFLDAYLQIDRGGEHFDEDTVTDPVCGMRINRSAAAATVEYLGHPYYFCSPDCRAKFTKEPAHYVTVKAE